MSETVASARELFDRDPTFRAGVTAWVADRRCDLRLVDLLLEYGLTAQADCARWAATEPDRPCAEERDKGTRCGPFPSLHEGDFYWYDCEDFDSPPSIDLPRDAHDVPRGYFGREVNYLTDRFKSAADAILFLLDNWKPQAAVHPD